jgi:hypothetical protein
LIVRLRGADGSAQEDLREQYDLPEIVGVARRQPVRRDVAAAVNDRVLVADSGRRLLRDLQSRDADPVSTLIGVRSQLAGDLSPTTTGAAPAW